MTLSNSHPIIKTYNIYTDGSCLKNPGNGGWSFVVYDDHHKHLFEDSGHELNTTNNRMELQGAIHALEYASLMSTYSPLIKTSVKKVINIFTDSRYVQRGLNEWLPNWILNNWKGTSGKPVKNKDLWLIIKDLNVSEDVIWHWVKAHNGNVGNEAADILASGAARKSKYFFYRFVS